MSWWFGGLDDVILRWDQIHLKDYHISFPSIAHGPQTHSVWRSYILSNQLVRAIYKSNVQLWWTCRDGLVRGISILYHHHHYS
jgi:hypothetical protein